MKLFQIFEMECIVLKIQKSGTVLSIIARFPIYFKLQNKKNPHFHKEPPFQWDHITIIS